MMKYYSSLVLILFALSSRGTMTSTMSQVENMRSITVVGNAELHIVPDEIIYSITIKEYWKEELKPNTNYKDYKTKVPMERIEPIIFEQLAKAGVKASEIKVVQMGSYYRPAGKDFLVSKTIELSLKDFEIIDQIAKTLDSRGVSNMYIKELKHSNIKELNVQVRKMAIKAAKEKAGYLLECLDEKVGKVQTIKEFIPQQGGFYRGGMLMNKSADRGNNTATDLKKFTISYRIEVTFLIAE